ncbi:hypothetical protein [Vibrio sp. 10N.239.312.D08]|uniref:hypothetical protein n=1 Tax=Vibrio sp. 10N.239.312.D08 TaxID=3229978 RepID=UPI003552FA90
MKKERQIRASIYEQTCKILNTKVSQMHGASDIPFGLGYTLPMAAVMQLSNAIERAKIAFVALDEESTVELMDKTENLINEVPELILNVIGDLIDHLEEKRAEYEAA